MAVELAVGCNAAREAIREVEVQERAGMWCVAAGNMPCVAARAVAEADVAVDERLYRKLTAEMGGMAEMDEVHEMSEVVGMFEMAVVMKVEVEHTVEHVLAEAPEAEDSKVFAQTADRHYAGSTAMRLTHDAEAESEAMN